MIGAFFRLSLTSLVLGLVLFASSGALAQDEENGGIVLPLSPDPARCTITPRSLDEVRAVWEATMATPVAAPEPIDPDMAGTPADEATVAAVTELLVNVIACSANGNDGLRDAAYLTDDHLRDNVSGLTEEEFTAWYTESPVANPPENWLMVYAVHDVKVLADGRISVRPDIIVPGVGHFIDILLLEEVDGRWLIDQSQEGDGNLYPVTAMDGVETTAMEGIPAP